MGLKRRLIRSIVSQFGHPRGVRGHLAGWVMGRRPSNVQRSRWAVDLLDLQPTDRLLEVGCGPGVAIAAAASRAAKVVGVDRSAVMIAQARRRNRIAVRNGRVELRIGRAEDVSALEGFDKALAINTTGHWDDPVAGLAAVGRALRPGGTIAVVSQPRCPGATSAHSAGAADELARLLAEAGYRDARIEMLDLDPPAVCALATNPARRRHSI